MFTLTFTDKTVSTLKIISSEHPKASVIVHMYSPELILASIAPVEERIGARS